MSSIKFVAGQAKYINQYRNIRVKVQNCCANIYFNRQCLKQGVIPIYAQIKIPNTSPASKITQNKTQVSRIKEEIIYLYKKKDILNESLYKTHLQASIEWGKSWNIIRDNLHGAINKKLEKKYDFTLNKFCCA
jgi:hypothetical protein